MYNFNRSLALRLKDAGHEVLLLTPKGSYTEKLQTLGMRWIEAPMDRRSINPFRELVFLGWLRRLLIDESIDIVHSFTIKCCLYSSLLARLVPSLGTINTVSGLGHIFTSNEGRARAIRVVVQGLLKIALSKANSRVVLLNSDDYEMFARFGFSREQTLRLILGAGVNSTNFFPSNRKRENGEFRILLPARILRDKGVYEFVDAARILRDKLPGVQFLLAGSPDYGNPSAIPEVEIISWVNDGVLIWLGHVECMRDLYHTVDLVVLPSYREGLPTSLTEAAMCSLPLIATDVPGCRDVIDNEINGILIPVKNSIALADQIQRLAKDPDLRLRLSAAACLKANLLFEEGKILDQNISVYSELSV